MHKAEVIRKKGKITTDTPSVGTSLHGFTWIFLATETTEFTEVLAGMVFLADSTLKVSPFDFAQDILYHRILPSSTWQ